MRRLALIPLVAAIMLATTATADARVFVENWRLTLDRTGAISVEPCDHKPCGRLWFRFRWHGETVGHGSVPCPRAPSLHIVSADNRNATVFGCGRERTFSIRIPYSD